MSKISILLFIKPPLFSILSNPDIDFQKDIWFGKYDIVAYLIFGLKNKNVDLHSFFFNKNEVYKNMSLIFGLKLRTSEEQAEAENFEKNKSKRWKTVKRGGTQWNE